MGVTRVEAFECKRHQTDEDQCLGEQGQRVITPKSSHRVGHVDSPENALLGILSDSDDLPHAHRSTFRPTPAPRGHPGPAVGLKPDPHGVLAQR